VTERQATDEQARHDLVADAEQQRAVEHLVRQRHRGRHRDHVPAKQ
jgi:hypothetical protein